jgi:hypothetical protein
MSTSSRSLRFSRRSGVFGVAVLASVFSRTGAYTSPAAFAAGFKPALWAGVIFTLAAVILTTPGLKRAAQANARFYRSLRGPARQSESRQPATADEPECTARPITL